MISQFKLTYIAFSIVFFFSLFFFGESNVKNNNLITQETESMVTDAIDPYCDADLDDTLRSGPLAKADLSRVCKSVHKQQHCRGGRGRGRGKGRKRRGKGKKAVAAVAAPIKVVAAAAKVTPVKASSSKDTPAEASSSKDTLCEHDCVIYI